MYSFDESKLSNARTSLGLTQKDLTTKINQQYSNIKLTRSTLSRWENGLQVPSSNNVAILADFFCLPIQYFYGEQNILLLNPAERIAFKRLKKEGVTLIKQKDNDNNIYYNGVHDNGFFRLENYELTSLMQLNDKDFKDNVYMYKNPVAKKSEQAKKQNYYSQILFDRTKDLTEEQWKLVLNLVDAVKKED